MRLRREVLQRAKEGKATGLRDRRYAKKKAELQERRCVLYCVRDATCAATAFSSEISQEPVYTCVRAVVWSRDAERDGKHRSLLSLVAVASRASWLVAIVQEHRREIAEDNEQVRWRGG